MSDSFFFYDLETSGINPRTDRVMQFAGQRTDLDLNPIGEPYNILISLSEDILPSPDAILVTGITPQQTQLDGITEVEFLKIFDKEISIPGTIFAGFNSVRFDDEFMRCLMYRNFYDPYEWQYKDGRSKWDLLDLVRMTRALRPEGINWPVDDKGKPTNRLELITELNGLDHANAHDALNDVYATISLAKLLRNKQPKLFDWLLKIRDKKSVIKITNEYDKFVYSSGKYDYDCQKTTVVTKLTENSRGDGALVYDLRFDPSKYLKMSVSEIVDAWKYIPKEELNKDNQRLPIKTLKYNRCPAVAPLAVMDDDSQNRLKIDISSINKNFELLQNHPEWPSKLLKALEIMDEKQTAKYSQDNKHVDSQLYDGFLSDQDKKACQKIKNSNPEDLTSVVKECRDKRLVMLLPLYKARNFPKYLSGEERQTWDEYKKSELTHGGNESKLAKYIARINELSQKTDLSQNQMYVLEDLMLYGQSLLP